MVELQSLLEHACFTFGRMPIPSIVRGQRYDYAEALELHEWARVIYGGQGTFALGFDAEERKGGFKSAVEVREVVLHRTRIGYEKIERLLLEEFQAPIRTVDADSIAIRQLVCCDLNHGTHPS